MPTSVQSRTYHSQLKANMKSTGVETAHMLTEVRVPEAPTRAITLQLPNVAQ